MNLRDTQSCSKLISKLKLKPDKFNLPWYIHVLIHFGTKVSCHSKWRGASALSSALKFCHSVHVDFRSCWTHLTKHSLRLTPKTGNHETIRNRMLNLTTSKTPIILLVNSRIRIKRHTGGHLTCSQVDGVLFVVATRSHHLGWLCLVDLFVT